MIWMISCRNISLILCYLSGYMPLLVCVNCLYIVFYVVLTLAVFVRVICFAILAKCAIFDETKTNMKLRVILSLIVALFIGQSMYAMSNEVLRRPIILDGEIIEEGSRSINPLIPISADIDGSTLFIKFSKAIGNVDIAVKEITDAKKEVYSSSMDVNAAGQITSFSIADLTPGTYVLEFTNAAGGYVYGQFIVE